MNAYEAMGTILDINETMEDIKQRNSEKEPDRLLCKVTELLEQYRILLCVEMTDTTLKVFQEKS